MELAGLGLGQLALVFGGAGLATLALYLLKLRRRQVRVPFVRLWASATEQAQSSQLFSSLKHWLSFLLALSIVALLSLALGDPRPARSSVERHARLLLVDASVTMQALDAGRPRLGEALERARAEIEALEPGEPMLLAQVDGSVTPLTALTDDRDALLAALDQVQGSDLPLAPEAALGFARNLLAGQSHAELVWISDFIGLGTVDPTAPLARDGIALRRIVVGGPGRNVGVSAFAVRRYPLDKSRSQAFVELHNGGDRPERVELDVLADERVIEHQSLDLPAHGRAQRVFDALAGADRRVRAHVRLADGTADALAVDDRAVALLPERRRARVLAVSDGNLYLEAALLLDEYLEVHTQRPAAYRPGHGADYDVVIFDRFVPDEPPQLPSIYLAPEGHDGFPFPVKGVLDRPYFAAIERSDPLLRFIALDDVNIGHALQLEPQPGDRVLGRSDSGPPLLLRASRAGVPLLALAFDVRDSDLPLRVAWPVLIIGMIDALAGTDAAYLDTERVGERVSVRLPAGASEAELRFADGRRSRQPAAAASVQVQATRAGFVSVRAAGAEQLLAFNLRPETPRSVAPATPSQAAAAPAAPAARGPARWLRRQPPWLWLVAAVALLLALEWLSYQRRWTL
jgi:hypothetical protein